MLQLPFFDIFNFIIHCNITIVSATVNFTFFNSFQEIVFAFKPCIEGETTALYIKKILEVG
mgnify:CR=1 FL=1